MSDRRRSPSISPSEEEKEEEPRSSAVESIELEMSMPTHVCGPPDDSGTEERIEPERPDPHPRSRISDGERRSRRESARCVICAWMDWMREEVVYLRASVSL